jgi:hypothetical protein
MALLPKTGCLFTIQGFIMPKCLRLKSTEQKQIREKAVYELLRTIDKVLAHF